MSFSPRQHGAQTPQDEPDVRHALGSLVTDEPALGLGYEQVVSGGRRLRFMRRSVLLGTPVAVLAMVGAGLLWGAAAPSPAPKAVTASPVVLPPVTVAAATAPLTVAGRATLTKHAATQGLARVLEQVARDHTPAGWTLVFDAQDWGGLDAIDASVTLGDGSGPGHLSLSATVQRGMLTVHPCTDSEFRGGATCTETRRSDGSFLTIRGLQVDGSYTTYLVSITRKNGTGTFAEAGNFVVPPQPPSGTLVTPEQKAALQPQITRALPVYSLAQLEAMVVAADAAVRVAH